MSGFRSRDRPPLQPIIDLLDSARNSSLGGGPYLPLRIAPGPSRVRRAGQGRHLMSFSSAHPEPPSRARRQGVRRAHPGPGRRARRRGADRDLLVSAQTGSGKTVAFGLALATPLLGEPSDSSKPGAPRALIVAPDARARACRSTASWPGCTPRPARGSRRASAAWIRGASAHARSAACTSSSARRAACAITSSAARSCSRSIEAVVLDEADEMLDMGFREDLERLLDAAPAERRTLMFSATIPKDDRDAREALPEERAADRDDRAKASATATSSTKRCRSCRASAISPSSTCSAITTRPARSCSARRATASRTSPRTSRERGFSVAALSGELSQRERNQALQALRDGRARVCVATDVAARGLDLPDLGLVIHADLPQNAQVLVHRSGRTGRAGKQGPRDPDRARPRAPLRRAHAPRGAASKPTWKHGARRPTTSASAIRISSCSRSARWPRSPPRTTARSRGRCSPTAAAEDAGRRARPLASRSAPAPEELTLPPSMRPRRAATAARRGAASSAQARSSARLAMTAVERRPSADAPRHRAGAQAARAAARVRTAAKRRRTRGDGVGSRSTSAARRTPIRSGSSRCSAAAATSPSSAIGKIQILARETRVEIAADASERFAEAVRRPDAKDRNIHIEPLDTSAT